MICFANHLAGFYMMITLVVKGLTQNSLKDYNQHLDSDVVRHVFDTVVNQQENNETWVAAINVMNSVYDKLENPILYNVGDNKKHYHRTNESVMSVLTELHVPTIFDNGVQSINDICMTEMEPTNGQTGTDKGDIQQQQQQQQQSQNWQTSSIDQRNSYGSSHRILIPHLFNVASVPYHQMQIPSFSRLYYLVL